MRMCLKYQKLLVILKVCLDKEGDEKYMMTMPDLVKGRYISSERDKEV